MNINFKNVIENLTKNGMKTITDLSETDATKDWFDFCKTTLGRVIVILRCIERGKSEIISNRYFRYINEFIDQINNCKTENDLYEASVSLALMGWDMEDDAWTDCTSGYWNTLNSM